VSNAVTPTLTAHKLTKFEGLKTFGRNVSPENSWMNARD